MTQQNKYDPIIDIGPRLTSDVFSTASLLQRQVHALEERCRASEKHADRLKKTRSELQAILSTVANGEKAEAHATADLSRTLERLRGGNGAGHSFATSPPGASAAASPQSESMSSVGITGSPLARLARETLSLGLSSPRGPFRPPLLTGGENAETDPHSGGHRGLAGADSHPIDSFLASQFAGAQEVVADFLQCFSSDSTRRVGQRGYPGYGRVNNDLPTGEVTFARTCNLMNRAEAVGDPCARLDPRLQTVFMGAHVESPARLGSDMTSMKPCSQSLTEGRHSDSDLLNTNSLLAVPLVGHSDDTPGAAAPPLADRIEVSEMATDVGVDKGRLVRAVQAFTRTVVTRKLAGKCSRGREGSQDATKTRSPRKRPSRVRAKSSVIGAPPLLGRFVRRTPAPRPGTPTKAGLR
ncbi:hypothetical protein BN946_scf184836.g11 [Trametes cinnabarina]|uniref:Uncharacterized protein n=1 Tax=Pycnoporus cinnabarinus TaxID=5643 RepID=A0A060S633_PYCCI|nr:hypothetical protein BN946_scf184836.g11 [Trametes cinnabarina]